MTKLLDSTLFALNGSTLNDCSLFSVPVTANSMTTAQIEDEEIQGKPVKCIYFNTTGYLSFNLDSTFFSSPWTVEWWEKDEGSAGTTCAVFTNIVVSSGGPSIGFINNSSTGRNMMNLSVNGSSYLYQDQIIGTNSVGSWVHRVVCYTGNDYKVYENGKLLKTFSSSATVYPINTFQMGRFRTTSAKLNKKIYNFRVVSEILYEDDFTPSTEDFTIEAFNIIKSKNIYTYNLLPEFSDVETIEVSIDNEPYKTFNAGEIISIDTTDFEAKDYKVNFTLKSPTRTINTTEVIKVLSPQYLQESASFNDIINKIKVLNENQARIKDVLIEKLKNLGIEATETKISELLDRLDEVQAGDGLEFVEHDGAPVFLGTPKPAIELKTTGFQATDKTISLGDDKHYLARVYGTGFTGTSSSICNDGTGYIDTNYALKDEGAIVIKFSATDTLSKTYGRVFRANTDGPSLYYKQATGKYEIKFYGVAGGYMQDIDPSSIKLKKVILTWSMKKKVAKLYADGALIKTLELDSVNFNPGSSLHIGDNQQFDTSRNAYTIPYYIYEFKAFDCYLDENIITEV